MGWSIQYLPEIHEVLEGNIQEEVVINYEPVARVTSQILNKMAVELVRI